MNKNVTVLSSFGDFLAYFLHNSKGMRTKIQKSLSPSFRGYQPPGISLFFTAVWVMYLLLSPIYIFAQGLPQPGDYIIFIFGFPLLLFSAFQHRGPVSKAFLFGFLFAGLTMLINLIHTSFLPDPRFFKHSIYYVFNFCVFLYTILIFKQSPYLVNKLTYIALATAIVFQFIYAPFFGDIELLRNTGSFNNPNQLAYWCILSLALLIIVKRDQPFTKLDLVLFGMLFYLQTLSLSKAGLIVTALIFPIIVFLPNMQRSGRVLALLAAFMFLITQVVDPNTLQNRLSQIEQFTAVVERIENIGVEGDDSAEGRGYDRILQYPHFVFFGAGEGAFTRFGIGKQEIHSGFATILFSYGLTGLLFFAIFLGTIFFRLPVRYGLLLFCILLFGIPHQNIRFTYFWIFLGIAHTHHLFVRKKEDMVPEDFELNGSYDQGRVGTTKSE